MLMNNNPLSVADCQFNYSKLAAAPIMLAAIIAIGVAAVSAVSMLWLMCLIAFVVAGALLLTALQVESYATRCYANNIHKEYSNTIESLDIALRRPMEVSQVSPQILASINVVLNRGDVVRKWRDRLSQCNVVVAIAILVTVVYVGIQQRTAHAVQPIAINKSPFFSGVPMKPVTSSDPIVDNPPINIGPGQPIIDPDLPRPDDQPPVSRLPGNPKPVANPPGSSANETVGPLHRVDDKYGAKRIADLVVLERIVGELINEGSRIGTDYQNVIQGIDSQFPEVNTEDIANFGDQVGKWLDQAGDARSMLPESEDFSKIRNAIRDTEAKASRVYDEIQKFLENPSLENLSVLKGFMDQFLKELQELIPGLQEFISKLGEFLNDVLKALSSNTNNGVGGFRIGGGSGSGKSGSKAGEVSNEGDKQAGNKGGSSGTKGRGSSAQRVNQISTALPQKIRGAIEAELSRGGIYVKGAPLHISPPYSEGDVPPPTGGASTPGPAGPDEDTGWEYNPGHVNGNGSDENLSGRGELPPRVPVSGSNSGSYTPNIPGDGNE